MLSIDEKQLKLLLEKKRRALETPKYSGIGEIISSISLILTLSLADFSNLTIIKPLYFKIVVWGISLIILGYGIFSFVKSLKKTYTVEQLYSEISEIDPTIKHCFNIVVIRNNENSGEYLLFKSKRWKCWLFPNYHCLNENFNTARETKYIKNSLKRDLNISGEISLKYIGNIMSEKYSVGDRVNKKYLFYFFQATDAKFRNNSRKAFRINGKKYCWKTLDQMYSDKNMISKNKDVLDYVRHLCDIS